MPTSTGEALTLRALVTTKEAGVIIGKAGKHVADLREQTGVKAGVSKVVPGVHERVLSVSGTVEGIAKAYTLIVRQLLDPEVSSNVTGTAGPAPTNTSLRLLISHNLMGTIIGRQGLKIKAIQDASGARMTASKEMLPQSTERVVEVHGTAEGIGRAVEEIARSLLEDWERGLGTVFYHPGVEGVKDTRRTHGISEKRRSAPNGAPGKSGLPDSAGPGSSSPPSSPPPDANGATQSSLRTQNISIPSDMVGCIIGRQGSKITEIRRLSGSKISIAKTPHDETGERMFTIIGTPEANEKALFLLYNQLESEKERRVGRENAAAAAASPGGVGTE
ncbi:cytoplasmic protein [Cantharellus anzutake]|uniref:cytoplasmic protein n=1 Tax=Cantharellus anzutake TaxID=1750568 RepID=UPI0019042E67|nr:cytoplasmic protein [Cantharellus anzutake]XP_038918532.1 cytoplasmic protein [Cantharellus anzutake]KAF8329688.1 cytoplasmic protein [Cantharellus anzutake]KAF8335309.1 cytoplasmic protein [Cantharellus anzutake]